jgi:hypothetical protein
MVKLGASEAAGEPWTEPTEDNDPREAADPMASGCDHASIDLLAAKRGDMALDGALLEIGPLIAFEVESRDAAGELDNLRLKLHFFDGVFGAGCTST